MKFTHELQKVAELIDGIIRNDDFPSTIRPEFLKDAVRDYPLRKGKRLRPAILLWSCGLLGGNPETAKFAAAAAEIYHNWTLVHDDIIDNDNFRRGLPSIHRKIADMAKEKYSQKLQDAFITGKNFAILVGDIQQGWAVNMLLKSIELGLDSELVVFLSRRLQELVNRELISGEALDVESALKNWSEISLEAIEEMLYKKTGALLRFCAECGALIALGSVKSANDIRVKKLSEFAAQTGLAFQLRDDWLGIFGNEKELGKPLASDLSESKPTLLLLKTCELCSREDKKFLQKSLGEKIYSSKQLDKIKKIVSNSGAEKFILDKAETLINNARNILLEMPDNKYRKLLLELNAFLITRNK